MKRVFLSFKMEDKKQVDGIRLLAWRDNIDLDFFDESVRKPYDSEDAVYIRRRIREKISRASVTVGFLGVDTHKSSWVDWELATSLELEKKVILIGLPGGPNLLKKPSSVQHLPWHAWSVSELQRLINE